jgi:hypothetical protein
MATTPTVQLYGKMYDRFDTAKVKETIHTNLLDKAFELSVSKDDDAKEDFIDALPLHGASFTVLSAIVFNSEGGIKKAAKDWKATGKFGLAGEEFSVGVGPTFDDAKLQFVNVD